MFSHYKKTKVFMSTTNKVPEMALLTFNYYILLLQELNYICSGCLARLNVIPGVILASILLDTH